jgi:O-antigen ligase
MMENITIGLLSFTGALVFCLWGFLNAYKETKETTTNEKFNWVKATVTVLPPLMVGFLAGYQMDPNTVVEYLSVVMAGYGQAALQRKLGVNSFFDQEE